MNIPESSNKKLAIIDGNALLHRAFHAYPNLSTSKGETINAVFGFASMLMLVLERLRPEYLLVVFDEKEPTFRHQQFTQYKAQRKPMDEGLAGQIERTREVVRAFHIPILAVPGYEADDVIGTVAKKVVQMNQNVPENKLQVILVTGDRDLLQLLSEDVRAMMPGKSFGDGVMYGVAEFRTKFGLEQPMQLVELKALMGDASDNIPGVHGIGEKTAQKLIAEYGSVEKIYENIDAIEVKTKEKLVAGAEMAMVSKSLATIDCAVPIQFELDECKRDGVDFAKVQELFAELEFKSLAQRLQKLAGVHGQEPTGEVEAKKPEEGKHTLATLEKFLEGQPEHVKQLDLEMVPVLARMTEYGVLVDRGVLEDLQVRFQKKIEELTKDIYETVGHEFNLNSPKQLAVVLFDELALPVIRKTKTGRSTNEEVLQELIAAHPVIEKILQYREMFKLQSTYIEGLPKYIAEDGRIHSQFNLDVAATGRLSSTDPNLQNIPIKSQWGNEIRKAFVAPQGSTLVALDYSQIELRILAHLSGDPGLQRIFQSGEDVHRSTAAKIFNVKPEEVTKDQRRSAKTINFGLMYGMGPRALAQDLQITFSQAELFIKAYFAAFPKVKAYMDEVVSFGTKHGYVETILGRRRFLPELKSSDMRLRSMGVRMAINMPCQGTQAEMIKKAMIEIDKELEVQESRMILQIHDELVFEMSEDCVEKWIPIIRTEMIEAVPLSVPIEVGVKVGKSWGEMVERD